MPPAYLGSSGDRVPTEQGAPHEAHSRHRHTPKRTTHSMQTRRNLASRGVLPRHQGRSPRQGRAPQPNEPLRPPIFNKSANLRWVVLGATRRIKADRGVETCHCPIIKRNVVPELPQSKVHPRAPQGAYRALKYTPESRHSGLIAAADDGRPRIVGKQGVHHHTPFW